jgi:phosphatidylglycerol:prolipoprotein diacylglycerol transferase
VAWLDGLLPSHVAATIAPSWFTCVGLSGLVLLLLVTLAARRRRIDRGAIASAVLWCYVAAVAAGIAVPMLLDAIEQLAATGRVRVRWAGMTSFWGYLAGLGAAAIVCRRHGVPLARLGDLAAAPLGVALAVARLGCFLGGCDYGKVTSAPWAVRFPSGSPAWRDHVHHGLVPADRGASLAVHPTQLYEALLGLAIAGVALWAARRAWARAGAGRVFLVAAAAYALGRIAIERFRGDAGRGLHAGLSSGQIFSILALAAIAGGLVLARRRARASAASARIAATTLALAIVALARPVAAQPAPQPPYGPQPAPRPSPAPQQPYGPQPAPQPPPPYPPPPPPYPQPHGPQPVPPPYAAPPAPAPSWRSRVTIGALFGLAMPVNRRPEQVPGLGGPSVSIGYALDRAALWLDLDSYGNTDASHGTLLVSAGVLRAASPSLSLGGRAGVGPTLVSFDEPAFQDVVGTSLRIEALAEYALGASWVVWVRPLSFETLIAADLGGPITTWQARIGLAYRVGARPAQAGGRP